MPEIKIKLGLNELQDSKSGLGKALLAELFGNLLLNFFGCLSCVSLLEQPAGTPPNIVLVAFTFGLVIFTSVQALGHVSGGHFNPAVTVGMLATGNVSVIRGVFYVVAQCLGAIAGSLILKSLTPVDFQGNLGMTTLNKHLTPTQGMGIEFFLGFVLVLVIFGVCDGNKPHAKAPAALAIGLTVALGHLAAIDFTGASMNPARTFGSAVVANIWTDHWVYWVGPSLGGLVASLLYTFFFVAPRIEEYSPIQIEERELKRVNKREDLA
uniref:Aquaporin 2-like protein n=1 Tax=Bactericera cockerelli TaxID=290155 RepID=V5V0L3_9HEMI|nr:aquaporin 2-like protein [Bactericera cockerelli]